MLTRPTLPRLSKYLRLQVGAGAFGRDYAHGLHLVCTTQRVRIFPYQRQQPVQVRCEWCCLPQEWVDYGSAYAVTLSPP